MSQGDFTMIMVLLTENFSEGQPAVTATTSSTSAVSQNAASSNPNQASGSTTSKYVCRRCDSELKSNVAVAVVVAVELGVVVN